jgi:pimeloyl-ACP methyl ester carboxylesterase
MDQYRRGDLVFDVRDAGPQDGPVVVLLHGFPQHNDSWDAVIERLTAQGYRCLAPNQRGYSPGARPRRRRDYVMTELVADVGALIDASGADKVHLVGHDWGAAVAWGAAAEYPERLATVTPVSVPHPGAFLMDRVWRPGTCSSSSCRSCRSSCSPVAAAHWRSGRCAVSGRRPPWPNATPARCWNRAR